jgi:hypothetical protein
MKASMNEERIYAALLACYPRAFRDAYGGEMRAAFRELRRADQRPPLAFWRFVLADLARSVCHEQIDACRSGTRRFVLQWLALCALGIVGTGLAAGVIARGIEYLYHPYLEGVRVMPWSYGAMLGAGLALAQCAALRGGRADSVAWIAVTAAGTALGLDLAASLADPIGPAASGAALGAIVGGFQWMLVGARRNRRSWIVPATAVSLAAATLLFDSAIGRVLAGMNPLAAGRAEALSAPRGRDAMHILIAGLTRSGDWTDVSVACSAMALAGLVAGAVTARQLAGGRHAHQAGR